MKNEYDVECPHCGDGMDIEIDSDTIDQFRDAPMSKITCKHCDEDFGVTVNVSVQAHDIPCWYGSEHQILIESYSKPGPNMDYAYAVTVVSCAVCKEILNTTWGPKP